MTVSSPSLTAKRGLLDKIESVGNKIPDITMLFFFATIICLLLSFGLSFFSFDFLHPVTQDPIVVRNLMSGSEILSLLTSMVNNFVNFPPLGIVIVATLGIGIAESSGYINTVLRKLLSVVPLSAVTPAVIMIGIFAHVAADSAYVILMPVAAYIFYKTGKHPLAGIAAAFAGLAGGFTASYTPSIVDPIMAAFTESAAHIIEPNYVVNVLCNYFFSFACTFPVIGVCWYITDKIVEPRLKRSIPVDIEQVDNYDTSLNALEKKAFRIANITLLVLVIGFVLMLIPEDSMFRAENGSLTSHRAPAMQIIVPLLLIFFAIPGLIYGYMSNTFASMKDVTKSMEDITRTLISFIVFAFFCAQFLYVFKQSDIGTLIAISGAEGLKALNMPGQITVLGVILLTACLNLIITSASSKWAILAPVLVPMLMLLGLSPELTQASFRISDSAVNVVTPMFAFYPLIIAYMQKYCSTAGVGTLVASMLPYTIGLLISFTVMLFVFWGLDIPLGFDASYEYIANQ